MNLRVRSKAGVSNLRGIHKDMLFEHFKLNLIQKETGIPLQNQKILAGFPPQEILAPPTSPIGNIFSNGDVLTVEFISSSELQTNKPEEKKHEEKKPEEKKPEEKKEIGIDSGPGFVMDGGPTRRLIPDDNSCLFHAIGYVLENKKNVVNELRKLVANTIEKDPYNYNEGILEKKPEDYQKWIQTPNAWGGSVELNIFAQHYKCEIVAYDVTKNRANCFAEDKGYNQRVYLIYDGIHYDALVWNLIPSDPHPDFDITIFHPLDQKVDVAFKNLTDKEHKTGKFLDASTYGAVCRECGKKLKGEKEITAHAIQTKHTKFGQNE